MFFEHLEMSCCTIVITNGKSVCRAIVCRLCSSYVLHVRTPDAADDVSHRAVFIIMPNTLPHLHLTALAAGSRELGW
jgi:hypothetical protein